MSSTITPPVFVLMQLTHAVIVLVPTAIGTWLLSIEGDRDAASILWASRSAPSFGLFVLTVVSAASIESISVSRYASASTLAGTPADPAASVSRPRSVVAQADTASSDTADHAVACFVGMTLLVIFWLAQAEWLITPAPRSWVTGCAVTAAVVGIVLRTLAIRALGTRFVTEIRCHQAPVDTGIYRFLSHPSEAGLLLIAISAPLILNSQLTAVTAAGLLTPISIWRLRRENRVLNPHHAQRCD